MFETMVLKLILQQQKLQVMTLSKISLLGTDAVVFLWAETRVPAVGVREKNPAAQNGDRKPSQGLMPICNIKKFVMALLFLKQAIVLDIYM